MLFSVFMVVKGILDRVTSEVDYAILGTKYEKVILTIKGRDRGGMSFLSHTLGDRTTVCKAWALAACLREGVGNIPKRKGCSKATKLWFDHTFPLSPSLSYLGYSLSITCGKFG